MPEVDGLRFVAMQRWYFSTEWQHSAQVMTGAAVQPIGVRLPKCLLGRCGMEFELFFVRADFCSDTIRKVETRTWPKSVVWEPTTSDVSLGSNLAYVVAMLLLVIGGILALRAEMGGRLANLLDEPCLPA